MLLVADEDYAWTPYVLSYAEKICYINEHLYEHDRCIRNFTAAHSALARSMEKQYTDLRDYIMFFLKNGNPKKKGLLKRLALGYALYFINGFLDPRFRELREEIEKSF